MTIKNEETVVLYQRENRGVQVIAQVVKGQEVIKEATDTSEEVLKAVADYSIIGTFEGEEVLNEVGAGYRQTVDRGRKMFKEIWDEKVAPIIEKEKEEAAAAKAQAKAEREAEKARIKAEKEAAKAAKEAEKRAKEEAKRAKEEIANAAPQENA